MDIASCMVLQVIQALEDVHDVAPWEVNGKHFNWIFGDCANIVHASVASILSGTVCHTYISYACYDLTLVGSCFRFCFHFVSYHFMFRGYATDIRHVRLGRPGEQKGIGRQMM